MLDRSFLRVAVTRRHVLGSIGLGVGVAGLAACGQAAPAAPGAATSAPSGATATQSTPAASTAGSPKRGGKLVIGLDVNPDGLDPITTTAFSSLAVYEHLYMSLATLEYKTNKVVPDLAQSWSAVDPTTYEFKLRQGVKFHSGREVTADDVKYSIERLLNPQVNAPLRSYLGPVDRVEAVDKYTARIVMKTPFSPLVSVLADRRPCAIVDRDVVEKRGSLANWDGGSGPFKLVEYTPDVRVVLERNGDYYDKTMPYLDQIEFRIIPDEAARVAAIRAGEVDLTLLKDPKNARLLRGDKGVNLNETPSFWRSATPFNVKRGPLGDVRVRQAISYAIDRQEIINTVLLGEGVVTGPLPPGETQWALPVAKGDFPTWFPDLEKSKALLKEAGAEGLKISIDAAPAYAPDIPTAQVLQSQLKKVGIDLQVNQKEWAALLQAQRDRNFDLSLTFNTNRPDPDTYLSFAETTSSTNWGSYSNPKMDDLLAKGRASSDVAARKTIYGDAQRLYATDLPFLYLYVIKNYEPARPHVKGYVPMSSGYRLSLRETWLDK